MSKDKSNSKPPLAHRTRRRLGWEHAPDYCVVAIYRDESYLEVRGPGYFRLNTFTERMGETISTKPRGRAFQYENLNTRDPIPVNLTGSVGFIFDPRGGEPEKVSRMIKVSDEGLGEILQGMAFGDVRSQIATYTFEEIRRPETYEALEKKIAQALNNNPAIIANGFRDIGVTISHAPLPPMIEARLQEVAQRRFHAQATQGLSQAELVRTLLIELVERVSRQGTSEHYLNAADLLNTLKELESLSEPPTKMIEGEKVIPPPQAKPSAPPAAEPPIPVDLPQDTSPKKRSKSYLDPDFE